MVVVQLTGGLGNQMFQYAAAKKIAVLYGVEIKADLTEYQINKLRKFELGCFGLFLPEASRSDIKKIQPLKGNGILLAIRKRVANWKGAFTYIKQPSFVFQYYPEVEKATSDTYLEGYWQSEKYFRDISEHIRNDFTFRNPMNSKNQQLAERILSENSVSVHVRRGDYISSDVTKEFHGSCSLNYYLKAIELIQSKTDKPSFYIFSDDPDWVSNNFKFDKEEITFINHNTGSNSYEDMRLMSLCKHNIIANSSFSWWGAWLNPNREKIVTAPKNWFNPESRWFKQYAIDTSDILPAEWTKIEN